MALNLDLEHPGDGEREQRTPKPGTKENNGPQQRPAVRVLDADVGVAVLGLAAVALLRVHGAEGRTGRRGAQRTGRAAPSTANTAAAPPSSAATAATAAASAADRSRDSEVGRDGGQLGELEEDGEVPRGGVGAQAGVPRGAITVLSHLRRAKSRSGVSGLPMKQKEVSNVAALRANVPRAKGSAPSGPTPAHSP